MIKKTFYWYLYLVTFQAFQTRPSHASKHTLPRLAHVAAPGSINSKRLTAKPAREGFVSMCACTEPVRTGIGAVCVEYGRPKWPITMFNSTSLVHKNVLIAYFWHPMLVRPAMKRRFRLKAKTASLLCPDSWLW